MTVTGQKILSVYDPATGTVVQINTISEDGEFEKKGAYIKDSQGGRLFSGHESRAEFLCFDLTGLDQLKTWMKDRTPVRFVTYGLDEHILWYEDTYITVDERVGYQPYKRSGFRLYFEKVGGVHSIYKGANILYAINGWKDDDSNNLADGYAIIASASYLKFFTIGGQNIQCSAPGYLYFRNANPLTFPVSGAKLSFAVKLVSENLAVNPILRAEVRDYNSSNLSTVTANINSVLNIIMPANSYSLLLYPAYITEINPPEQLIIDSPLLTTLKSVYTKINY